MANILLQFSDKSKELPCVGIVFIWYRIDHGKENRMKPETGVRSGLARNLEIGVVYLCFFHHSFYDGCQWSFELL